MSGSKGVLIVGAGHGGAQAALTLRRQQFSGPITLIGDEPELPYDRPPLSKEYLSGEKSWDRMPLCTADAWAERRVRLLPRCRVVSVDPSAHTVSTGDGTAFQYDSLIWAAGGRARRLTCPGSSLEGVHTVRNRADVDRMIADLPGVDRVIVIGGGYIGLEAAASLTKFGKQVTVVEALDRVLARVAGEALSRFYEAEHRARGVDLRLNAVVDCIVERGGRAVGVRLQDGSILPGQMVIVGIGIVPAVDPLIAAGAEGGNGVRVDGQCRTNLPDVFAVGDCADHRNRFAGGDWIRLESVQNANDQATVAAKAILGGSGQYDAVPWFWSNQYDLRLQTVGLSRGYDQVVTRGNPLSRSFSIIYLKDSAVIALDCVNSARDYAQGRALVAGAARPAIDLLQDASIPLKSAMSPATVELAVSQ